MPKSTADSVSSSLTQAAQPRRRWYQFTLRTAGVWMVLLCLLLGSFAWWRDRAERQRKGVEELRALGATIVYRYFSLTNARPVYDGVYDSNEPADEFFLCSWLRSCLGEDFVSNIDAVYLSHNEDSPAVPVDATRLALRFLRHCPHVTILELEANAVSGAEFEQLPFFDSLEELTLVCREGDRGLVCDANLAPLKRSTRLRLLELEGQPIGDKGMSHLRNCRRLEVLRLGDTSIGDEGLRQLSELSELFLLNLSGTQISDAGLKHLGNFKKLRELSLADLNLDGEGLAEIGPLPELESLDLSESNVTDAALGHLTQFPSLDEISLIQTKVTGRGISHFANLPHVGRLWLAGCPLADENVAGIEVPDGIGMLWLSGTKITDAGFCKLKLAKTIYSVDLSHTSIGDASLDHLHSLPDLNLIEIKETEVTPNGIKRLQARFPRCTIHN